MNPDYNELHEQEYLDWLEWVAEQATAEAEEA